MYLLPKIHKRLVNALACPIISNCSTSTEKASEFLDDHLQPIMRSGMSGQVCLTLNILMNFCWNLKT